MTADAAVDAENWIHDNLTESDYENETLRQLLAEAYVAGYEQACRDARAVLESGASR
jgi:hypothetical protein